MSGRELDVIAAGDLFIDLILSGFSSWPARGTEAFAQNFRRELGGCAAITACGLAKLGSRTAVLSVVGHDHGAWVAERLAGCGVLASELQFDPEEPTGFAVAVTTAEDRTFFTYQGANRRFAETLAESAAKKSLSRARHVHLGWAPELDTAIDLLQSIRANGCTVSLDAGWHEAWLRDPRSFELMPLIDIFFPNEMEARCMTGEADAERSLRSFEAAGAKCVALKLGSQGAALLCAGEILRVEPRPFDTVDTIGAGDSFNAGFLHYWLRGANPMNCLRAANFCGGASTEAYGGVLGFPDAARVARAMEE